MSSEEPEIVLNEFGDLSRKARRELEAKGIDPDTAVMEFKIATGHIPIITEAEAAAARSTGESVGQKTQEEAVTPPPSNFVPPQVATSHSVPAPSMPPIPVIPPIRPMQTPVENKEVEIQASAPEVVSESTSPQAGFPRVDSTFVSANTGPIEPLVVEPALDDSSLAAVEQTLAAASDIPTPSAFDQVIAVEDSSDEQVPDAKPEKLSRREKKALAKEAKAAKVAEAVTPSSSDTLEGFDNKQQPQTDNVSSELTTAVASAVITENIIEEAVVEQKKVDESVVEETVVSASVESDVEEDSVVIEVSEGLTVIYEDEADSPQTISEVTAAIAVAEAVAAAEAAVEAGEVVMDFDSMSGVPTTTGSIPVISNALIIPTLPETTGQITPITQTGEVVITGSILIPPSVSQIGANAEQLDTSDIDIIAGDQEIQTTSTNMAPVSAAAAVSAYDIANSVITKPKGMNERLPFILSIAAAGLAVGVVAILVIGYINGIF